MDTNALRDAQAGRSPSSEGTSHTDLLIACGAVGGPLFATLAAAQALTRDGFDLAHQPLSLLSLGPLGWVQVASFVTTGILILAFAVGMRQVLTGGTGRTWAPLLMAISGAGLVAGGLFLPDPALGYPPGTPDAIPSDFSWHGSLHAAAPPLAFAALVACCLVFARRFLVDRRRGWAAYSGATAVATLTLSAWPTQEGASIRLAVAILVTFAWTTLLALRLRSPV
ncbi:MAG TPA: DUF998 domain-containing protein [Nocardioidaceae bacterium]|nr:DUF998 domain-containing protein [Nocardioidaceae bacterium]